MGIGFTFASQVFLWMNRLRCGLFQLYCVGYLPYDGTPRRLVEVSLLFSDNWEPLRLWVADNLGGLVQVALIFYKGSAVVGVGD